MDTVTAPPAATVAPTLRRLYAARFVFALVWAVLVVATAPGLGALTAVLLVLYPLVDVAAAVVELRSMRTEAGVVATVAISALAAVGLAVAVTGGVPAVLWVWGAWAVVAGLAQLVVALRRRRLGGQGAMIASGGLSVLAGGAFVLMASSAGASLVGVAGYALLGGVFFLVTALRLGRVRA
ncbi:hypothetical protein [Actinomycetospora flava]|uniref:Integral membrane protein n=1 Tax=Actinomycetospora flava TaxID=3129232 RepID=A0ABU8MAS5_9PSEU